jgi:hypothetical protein
VTPTRAVVAFADRETGWVEFGADGLWRVSNVPISDRFNLDDVVDVDLDGAIGAVRAVRSRRWPRKSRLVYSEPALWTRLSEHIRGSGMGWTEGWGRCRAGVAHDDRLTLGFVQLADPNARLEPLGLEPL